MAAGDVEEVEGEGLVGELQGEGNLDLPSLTSGSSPSSSRPHAHLLSSDGFQDEAKQAWQDYAHSDQLAKYGDEDDIAGNARKGLGSSGGSGENRKAAAMGDAFGISADVEERERREQLAKEEKGKGNRAFSEKRYDDAIRHFTVCIKLEPDNQVYHSNRSAAHAALKDSMLR